MTFVDTAPWNTTSFWSEEAEQQFSRARRRARWEMWRSRWRGDSACLDDFAQVRIRDHLLPAPGWRRQSVPLDEITGSLGKSTLFTRSFNPRSGKLRGRWKRSYALARGLRGYEPVELYRVGDRYFVVDGHFRISVARALGSRSIEAVVRRWG